MIPWKLLDKATPPGDARELRLMRRGHEYVIMAGADELMSNRRNASEEALATLACRDFKTDDAPRILIGGLGMGFTLRAAQGVLGPKAKIVVAELAPIVIAWAKGPLSAVFGDSLADPRLELVEGDVGELIRQARAGYDAILLDVDNGPHGLSRTENDSLYDMQGLSLAQRALRPGGVLAIWSSAPDKPFVERLRRSGYDVEEVEVRAHRPGKGPRHTIWLARRAGANN